MHWLAIGSAPTVLDHLDLIDEVDRVITCNAGIKLCPTPDVYLCVDWFASREFGPLAKYAQEQGTWCVTLHRDEGKMTERDVDWYDEFLDIPGHTEPTRESWGRFRYSGPLMVEYAIRRGATVLHMIGMDGYRHNRDYFDPETKRKLASPENTMWYTHTTDHVVPRISHLVRLFPEVQFQIYGNPCYTVDAPNWRVMACQL